MMNPYTEPAVQNAETTAEWGRKINALEGRVSPEMLENLRAMGPEGLAIVETVLKARGG